MASGFLGALSQLAKLVNAVTPVLGPTGLAVLRRDLTSEPKS
jgi:hypothetical protein